MASINMNFGALKVGFTHLGALLFKSTLDMVKAITTALRSKWFANTILLLTTAITGIMAGFFWAYSFNINLALSELNATSYVKVQALLNIHVRHPVFFSVFFGVAF